VSSLTIEDISSPFVRENMSAISGLASAVVNLMAGAVKGDSAGVATAVEATLCQVILLVVDLFFAIGGDQCGRRREGPVDEDSYQDAGCHRQGDQQAQANQGGASLYQGQGSS